MASAGNADRAHILRSLEIKVEVMLAAGIRAAGKSLVLGFFVSHRSIKVITVKPPGRPCAKSEIRPIGWGVAAGRGSDLPGHLCIGQRSTRIVFGFNRDSGLFTGEVRARGLIARGDLKLRPAEFLDLETVIILRAVQPAQAAFSFKIDLCVAKVNFLRNGEGEVKATQGVDLHPAAANFVALRLGDGIAYGSNRTAQQFHIAILLAANATQPAFDMQFFAGLIHLAVIKHVPAQFVIH